MFCATFGHITVFQTRSNSKIQFYTFDEYLLNSVPCAHISVVFSYLITPALHYLVITVQNLIILS